MKARIAILIVSVLAAGFLAGRFATREMTPAHAVGTDPAPGDVNGDGGVNITDAVYLLDFLFQGGPPPVDPAPRLDGASTVFIVRHAEREPGGCDALLKPEGEERAHELARVLAKVRPDAVITSDCIRTRLTVDPLLDLLEAEGLSPPVEGFGTEEEVVAYIKGLPAGSTAVVAGHSFTIHDIMILLGLPESVREIPISGRSYDNLFIVERCATAPPKLLHLKFPPFIDDPLAALDGGGAGR